MEQHGTTPKFGSIIFPIKTYQRWLLSPCHRKAWPASLAFQSDTSTASPSSILDVRTMYGVVKVKGLHWQNTIRRNSLDITQEVKILQISGLSQHFEPGLRMPLRIGKYNEKAPQPLRQLYLFILTKKDTAAEAPQSHLRINMITWLLGFQVIGQRKVIKTVSSFHFFEIFVTFCMFLVL